jgi:hypothetical protein
MFKGGTYILQKCVSCHFNHEIGWGLTGGPISTLAHVETYLAAMAVRAGTPRTAACRPANLITDNIVSADIYRESRYDARID